MTRTMTAAGRPTRSWHRGLCILFACLLMLTACAENSDAGAGGGDYYAGKTITITVPSSVGGGTDRAARLLAEFLQANVPGNPTVNVENVEAASPATVINDWMNRSAHDGTEIMMTSSSGHIPWLLGDKLVEYDLSKMQLLWANGSGRAVAVRGDAGVETAADLFDPPTELVFGAGSPADAGLLTVLGMEVLGINDKMKQVYGYGSNDDEVIAFQSGEIDLVGWTASSIVKERQDLLNDGTMRVLYTNGRVNDGSTDVKTDRDPLFPDVPTVEEVYLQANGTEPSGPAWDAFLLAASVAGEMGHAAWLQPDAPQEAVDILRTTIEGFVDDPAYVEKHGSELGAPVEPAVGAELSSLVEKLQSVDQSTLDWTREWLQTRWGVQL